MTDNAMTGCIEKMNIPYLGCFAHTIQLVLKDCLIGFKQVNKNKVPKNYK